MNCHLVNPSNLSELIYSAWNKSLARVCNTQNLMGDSIQIHNERHAQVWVDILAQEFKQKYPCPDFHVFWRSNPEEKNPICGDLKEFLFDIAVCRLGVTKSRQRSPKNLKFVAQAHWLVESEFDRKDFREIILDMSKLVIGASSYKLFVVAHRSKDTEKELRDRLAPIARCCGGPLFFAFVSHPREWLSEGQADPVIYQWSAETDQWLLIAS